jgi:WD40 repeat protein/DNA-binding SARP family transcriptional activator/energy-coupling factor transporter ATP-binding protein EcfA2
MEFRILGPLEVRTERGGVALGGIKPRTALAVLLLHANEPVSAERLALALWGEEAPQGAVKTVQVHVSRLRKALGDPDVVETTPAGYRLRVRPEELDADRFTRLVEEGRGALVAGDPARAGAILRTALSLWRGPALDDLAFEPFAQVEIARLEEQRLAALEARVEADLAVGRHAELVEELQRLVAASPTREGLTGQLMLALYRCGRQAEALEAYASARRVLVDEIGVEPGPELRRLQEAILRHDASLEQPRAVSELPPELDAATAPPLAGREGELAWLLKHWERARSGTGQLVGVTGAPGIGKSRLAAELAGVVHSGGAEVLYATGSGPCDGVLRRAREATAATLLVVDDVDPAATEVIAGVQALARCLATVPVLAIATGQDDETLAALGAEQLLALDPLGAEAVRALASRYAPRRSGADVPAGALLEASGGVPQLVHEAAGRWARLEAARRVGAVARRTAAGRAELRAMEAELTGDVAELQAAGEDVARGSDEAGPVVCPFKGLAAFDVADAEYFFGRERLIAELVARLVGTSLLAIVGASGSGKSSVLRAGLLPALAGGVLPGSDAWSQRVIRPGEHPLRELTAALGGVRDERFVLAVDQFEEAFTACADAGERDAFVAELVRTAGDREGRGIVLLAIRADYYGRCAQYPELSNLLAANHVLIGAMRPDELRRAITCPAARVGLRIDAGLTQALVADVEQEPGALPLLSTALLELWKQREGRHLRHAAYERTGGVRGAVARLAEDAYAQLDPHRRTIARSVVMRLVGLGGQGAVERRRVPLSDFQIDESDDVAHVLTLFTDQRLLTVSAGTVEVAHEALLREWPRLCAWIEENREGLRIQRSLSSAADEWRRLGRDDGMLYRGARLSEAVGWRARPGAQLSQHEREFLDAAQARAVGERAAMRRRRGLALASLAVVLVAGVAVVLAVVFTKREHDIVASRDLATKSESLVAADPELALALALEALKRNDNAAARSAVRQATYADRETAVEHADDGNVFGVTVSDDGQRLASAGEDGNVRIWSGDGRRLETTLHGKQGVPTLAASFSPDGKSVASVSVDGAIAVTDVRSGRRDVVLRLAGDDYARSIEFSRDGASLLVGTAAGIVGLVRIGDRPAKLDELGRHADRARARFARSRTRVVSVSDDDTARIWSVDGGAPLVLRHPDDVLDADFGPGDKQVATAGADGAVRIWDAATGRLVRTIRVDDGKLLSVRFSPDGRRLLVSGADGSVRLADVRGGPMLSELKGHAGTVYDAVFVHGGRGLVSVGQDGTLRTWAPLDVAGLSVRLHDDAPVAVSLSPDGKHLLAGYSDGEARSWSLDRGVATRLPGATQLNDARYSSDGRQVISASLAGVVRVWDGRRASRRVPAAAGERYAIAVDSTGRVAAIATLDADTVIQGPGPRDRVVLRGHTNDVTSLAFSPDDKHVVSGSEDRTLRLWSAHGTLERVLRGHDKAVLYATYSHDGRQVASADTNGTVRVWQVASGRSAALYGHEGQVNSVEFDRSGQRLVTAGEDGTVRVWSTAGGRALLVVTHHAGRALAASFSPDATQVLSVGDEGFLRVSPCEVCGSFADVLRIARSRFAPPLTATERERLQDDGP